MSKPLALVFALILVSFLTAVVSAQSSNAQIPEKNGDYPDLEHPGIRVRVFVHEPKEKSQYTPSVTCDDPLSDATVGITKWKLPSANWEYKINISNVPSSVGSSNFAGIAADGFNAWTSAISSFSKPTLVYAGTTTKTKSAYDGQNIITWGRASGSALGVTYIRYNSSGFVVDVDTIMNLKFPWILNACSTSAYEATNILTHELGHWFGLNDHYTSDYANNTMYGYGAKAEIKKITPEKGDKTGINNIYH